MRAFAQLAPRTVPVGDILEATCSVDWDASEMVVAWPSASCTVCENAMSNLLGDLEQPIGGRSEESATGEQRRREHGRNLNGRMETRSGNKGSQKKRQDVFPIRI